MVGDAGRAAFSALSALSFSSFSRLSRASLSRASFSLCITRSFSASSRFFFSSSAFLRSSSFFRVSSLAFSHPPFAAPVFAVPLAGPVLVRCHVGFGGGGLGSGGGAYGGCGCGCGGGPPVVSSVVCVLGGAPACPCPGAGPPDPAAVLPRAQAAALAKINSTMTDEAPPATMVWNHCLSTGTTM